MAKTQNMTYAHPVVQTGVDKAPATYRIESS